MNIPDMPPPTHGTMISALRDADTRPPSPVPAALAANVTHRTELESYLRTCAERKLTPNEVIAELRELSWTDAQARTIVKADYVPAGDRLPLLWWMVYGGFGFGVLGFATAFHALLAGLETDAHRNVFATALAFSMVLLPIATGAYLRSRTILADQRRSLARYSPMRRKLADVLVGCAATVGFVRLLAYLTDLIMHLVGGTNGAVTSGLTGVAQVSVSVVCAGALTTFAWSERKDARSDEDPDGGTVEADA